jgi:prevent-host-death family protein
MYKSDSIKPISYLKSHASEIIKDVAGKGKTMVITQNGQAKVILQDIKLFEQTQESLALLKILSLGSKSLNEGKFKPFTDSFKSVREKISRDNDEV